MVPKVIAIIFAIFTFSTSIDIIKLLGSER